MKILKKTALYIFILLTIVVLFRGFIYRILISYESVDEREEYLLENIDLITTIESIQIPEPNIDDIIIKTLEITSNSLTFSFAETENNPNKLIITQKANCVGYASFYTLVCNKLIENNNLNNQWRAKTQVGHLSFLGSDIHKFFRSSFFKDHDFVIIENFKTKEKFAVDPSINDYLKINFVKMN